MSDDSNPSPRPMYRLYLDESGDHTYKLLEDPSHRFLALMGVRFRLGPEYDTFSRNLAELKQAIFGYRADRPVILHRSDIINRRGPFGRLREPQIESQFNEGLLELIRTAPFSMICVIIDKLGHLDKYSRPKHPYHYCLEAVLDRYCGWLRDREGVGDVMAESRGKIEDQQLRAAYLNVIEKGTLMFDPQLHRQTLSSRKLKITPKVADLAGIQLADILAHPIKQACLHEKGLVSRSDTVFGDRIVEAVEGKFHVRGGRVEGYGKVLLSCK